MEPESSVKVKIEPDSTNEASLAESGSKVMLDEKINIKTEPKEENDGESLDTEEGVIYAPEAIMVKLEPKYYSSGDGQAAANAPSTSQIKAEKPLTFEDLLNVWEDNEESEEFGSFFAYCRDTADCGSYFIDTDSEAEPNEDVENIPQNHNTSKYYVGRNGYKWSMSPVPMSGKRSDGTPSCTMPGEKNPYNLWKCLLDDSIFQEVLKWTNVKLSEYKALIGDPLLPHLDELDMIELKAFFSSIMYTVYCNINIYPVREMYREGIMYMPVYDCIMSENRFLSILNCLSFGDPQLENESGDRNVAVLFEKFVENCGKMYKGSSYAVLGETIIPFWGDADDEIFPGKYTERPCRDGFRLQCMFDVANGFLYNLYIPYKDLPNHGFTEEEQQFRKGTQLALLLTQPIHGKNVNVTCNKEYMSLELIDALAERELTCIGPLEKIHKEIPPEFLPSNKRQRGTVLYGYSKKATLMSYVNKRKKATIIACSKPYQIDEDAKKPTLLNLYDRTKYARMLTAGDDHEYNFHRRTRLVSTALFYKLFEFSIHNTHILYSLNMKKKVPMHSIIKFIATELSKEHLMRRAKDISVPSSLRKTIVTSLKMKNEVEDDQDSSEDDWFTKDSEDDSSTE